MKLKISFNEKYYDLIFGMGLGFIAIGWFFIVGVTISRISILDVNHLIRTFTVIGGSVGVFVAIWKLFSDNLWNRSKVYLEESTELLEKAYSVLNQEGDKFTPDNSRQNWIACARLIMAAEHLACKIKISTHIDVYNEIRQYWRARFYSLIFPSTEGFPEEYFAESPKKFVVWSEDDQEPLSERSITYLYKFVKWPSGSDDPLKTVEYFTDDDIEQMKLFGPIHMANIISNARAFTSRS